MRSRLVNTILNTVLYSLLDRQFNKTYHLFRYPSSSLSLLLLLLFHSFKRKAFSDSRNMRTHSKMYLRFFVSKRLGKLSIIIQPRQFASPWKRLPHSDNRLQDITSLSLWLCVRILDSKLPYPGTYLLSHTDTNTLNDSLVIMCRASVNIIPSQATVYLPV